MRTLFFPLVCLALTAHSAFGGYQGSVAFTDAERREHAQGLNVIMDTAAKCLSADLARHQDFMRRFGISAFYGDNSSFAKKKVRTESGDKTVETTAEEKRRMLRAMRVNESLVQQLIPQVECFTTGENPVPVENPANREACKLAMHPTSCVGLTLKCLGEGFEAAQQGHLWKKALDFTLLNGTQGDALQVALQQLGWKVTYWNPNVPMARIWDLDEQEKYPGDPKHIWGQHEETSRTVFGPKHRYYLQTVDDWSTLVNFGKSVPAAIKKVPFFVGIAHLGYHVFPGSYGQIIEGHSTRQVNDAQSLETSPFNPLVEGGGPRGGPYKSGLIALPPGY